MATILALAPDDDVRSLVARLLERARHSVTAVGRGDEALELLRERPFDLLVIDLDLPGIHLFATVLRDQPDAPPVCCLGDPRQTPLGARPWVPKPFYRAHLYFEVETALASGDTRSIRG